VLVCGEELATKLLIPQGNNLPHVTGPTPVVLTTTQVDRIEFVYFIVSESCATGARAIEFPSGDAKSLGAIEATDGRPVAMGLEVKKAGFSIHVTHSDGSTSTALVRSSALTKTR
jgi:hypothetical protein